MTIIQRSENEIKMIEVYENAARVSYDAGREAGWFRVTGEAYEKYKALRDIAEKAEARARRVALDERGGMVACPECDGQGEFEHEGCGSSRSIEPTWSYSRCEKCKGSGELEALPEDVMASECEWYQHVSCEGEDACEYCINLAAKQAEEDSASGTVESV